MTISQMPEHDAQDPQAEIDRLQKIILVLMDWAEQRTSANASDFIHFQFDVMLETQIRRRTRQLEDSLRENGKIRHSLQQALERMEEQIAKRRKTQVALEHEKEEQRVLIGKLEEAHNQLLQSEKLAAIGQLAAGVAHEVNNPIGFVNSNLGTLGGYVDDLLNLIDAYEAAEPGLTLAPEAAERLRAAKARADLDFVREDIRSLIAESIEGTSRVRHIVQSLRDFSRLGDVQWQPADLQAGLESTLNMARNEIKYKAEIERDYGELPLVECIPAQINQVFLNLLVNAAQSIDGQGRITLRTRRIGPEVAISIIDTGRGIPEALRTRIFEPFFTTKTVGQGTGLGLSISYGIIQKHGGRIEVDSTVGQGSAFTIWLPVTRAPAGDAAG